MKHKINLKRQLNWSKLKYFWVIFWSIVGILLIVIIALLVVYQGSKDSVIENVIASVAFAFLIFLILAIFTQITEIYIKRKAKHNSGSGLNK